MSVTEQHVVRAVAAIMVGVGYIFGRFTTENFGWGFVPVVAMIALISIFLAVRAASMGKS